MIKNYHLYAREEKGAKIRTNFEQETADNGNLKIFTTQCDQIGEERRARNFVQRNKIFPLEWEKFSLNFILELFFSLSCCRGGKIKTKRKTSHIHTHPCNFIYVRVCMLRTSLT